MTKVNLGLVLPLVIILVIAAVTYIFFLPRDSYRNDCEKSVSGFDALFVYSVGCPHCKADLLRMKDLNLTSSFYMIDSGSALCQKIINGYSDYLVNHKNSNRPNDQVGLEVPTKVCLYDNTTYIGEMQEDQLKSFYENCTSVKK